MYNYRIPNKTTFPIALRVSDDEREAYVKYADSQGLTLSAAIRKVMEEKIANTTDFKTDFVSN